MRDVRVHDLLDGGLLAPGTVLVPVRASVEHVGEVDDMGRIYVNEIRHDTPSAAATAAAGTAAENGWTFWRAGEADDAPTLADLRQEFLVAAGGAETNGGRDEG